jgi:hypothetical protein
MSHIMGMKILDPRPPTGGGESLLDVLDALAVKVAEHPG